jgi:hypothetical protein
MAQEEIMRKEVTYNRPPLKLETISSEPGLDLMQTFIARSQLINDGKDMIADSLAHEILQSDQREILRVASSFRVLPFVGKKGMGKKLGESIEFKGFSWSVPKNWKGKVDVAMISFDPKMAIEYRKHSPDFVGG